MKEMNMSKPTGDDETGGIRMGFVKKYFDKKTIITFVIVLIMGIINYELVGFWGIFLYLILGPIGATIGNVIRLWVMPAGILTFDGFWGLVKVKLFWGYGPQFIGALICLGIAGSMVQNGREKQAVKQAEKSGKIIAKEIGNPRTIPAWTDEMKKTLSELQEEYKGPWRQTEFETTSQFNARVEQELKKIRKKYQSKGIETGKLYRFPWKFFITGISYDANNEILYFSIEETRGNSLGKAASLILFGKSFAMGSSGDESIWITKISADQARSIKEKLGFGGTDTANKKIPNDIIQKMDTSDDGCPMLRAVAYVIEENGPEKLQAWKDELKRKDMAGGEKQNSFNATAKKSLSALFELPVLTDEMVHKTVEAMQEFEDPKKGEFETTDEYLARAEAARAEANKNIGIGGVYRYTSDNINSVRYDADQELLLFNLGARWFELPISEGGFNLPVVIDGTPYRYLGRREYSGIKIPRDQVREIKEKLQSPNRKVHYMVHNFGSRIVPEPFCAITSE
jgi:hypothetical protein